MTRGFIVLKNGKEIISACELHSDAYPNGDYARGVYEAFNSENPNEEFAKLTRTCGEELDSEKVYESWWNISKLEKEDRENVFFHDYAYVYDLKTKKLSMFYFGKKVFTFSKKAEFDAEYLGLLVHDYDNSISFGLTYNPETKDFSLDKYKEFSKLIKAGKTPSEIASYAKGVIDGIHYSYQGSHIIDHVSSENFINLVEFPRFEADGYKYGGRVQIIYDYCEYNKKWSIVIQLPWIRETVIGRWFSSKRSAVKAGREYVEKNWKRLRNLPKLEQIYKRASEEISKFYSDNREGLSSKNNEDCDKFDSFSKNLVDMIREDLVKAGFDPKDDEKSNPENFCKLFSPDRLLREIGKKTDNLYMNMFVYKQKKIS